MTLNRFARELNESFEFSFEFFMIRKHSRTILPIFVRLH
jgi:hypothetical protein